MSKEKLGRILIVDDEVELMHALCEVLADEGYETTGAPGSSEGLKLLATREFDILLSDLMMPGMDGIQLLRQALEHDPNLIGIIMTGQGSIPTAVEAMKVGAFDYILKPFNLQGILPVLARAMELRNLRVENVRLKRYVERLTFESPRYELVGSSPQMQELVALIAKVAPSDATVLICGQSGTGKELVARALHCNSARSAHAMVTINCAALQETLLESELFGHEKGAFTGAGQAKVGLVEVADGGTLFIDEVAEMAPQLQAKLLRVLEDGHYRRVGGTAEHYANVRIIAATNKSLDEEQKAGRFREDLYYRLNVVTMALPSLKERRQDIPELVEHFLSTRKTCKERCKISPEALSALCSYSWPGNIRELANVLERAQILAEQNCITIDDLPDTIANAQQGAAILAENPNDLRGIESQHVRSVLAQCKWNKAQTAKSLGISRRALYRLIEKYALTENTPQT